jgi:hypothetical protein
MSKLFTGVAVFAAVKVPDRVSGFSLSDPIHA